ncbi:elongation factor P maturation arginine rhamnosyltransferase EarP [Comamonas sp. GB3 AK4-5]|uniref:elongation factor P maturation arginine rhamnosyltransferase EarP n=1 Tax=Comamonas sp. GB3 AK4-5 TaxID=3231487 RepID=UPI00351E3922
MLAFFPLPLEAHDSVAAPRRSWDIFCQVIDNFGDVGVCWRAAAELVARGQTVRLWMDDASALQWMAPTPHPAGLTVHAWPTQLGDALTDIGAGVGDVVVEAFGCEIPAPFVQAIADRAAAGQAPVWINLEYLSAEDYVARCHRLPSRLMSGPAAGLTRWFFYPGFTADTGGLLAEQDLPTRQAAFDRAGWRTARGLQAGDYAISLFCYEPPALAELLAQLQPGPHSAEWQPRLLLTPGRATAAVDAAMQAQPDFKNIASHVLSICPQPQFDEMLWACDLNLVRGEDSLVRALWAGQPMVWHIYPQHDNAHHAKLNAFLDWLQAPGSLRSFHHAWNGMAAPSTLPLLTPQLLREWQACMLAARQRLRAQTGLIGQLLQFVAEKS